MVRLSYLLAARDISVILGVEDEKGTPSLLTIDNHPGLFRAHCTAIDAIFPSQTVMAIREPHMREFFDSNVKSPTIKVDSPTDVILLGPSHPLLANTKWANWATADALKAKGDAFYRDRHYLAAIHAWSHAIEMDPTSCSLLLNRCQAYLRLEWHDAALRDATYVLQLRGTPAFEACKGAEDKGDYRAAVALYGLGRYDTALERFTALRSRLKTTEVNQWIARCRARKRECTDGIYDWQSIFNQYNDEKNPKVDAAEFVGPIEVCAVRNRGGGRGVRAKADVRAGDILVRCPRLNSLRHLPEAGLSSCECKGGIQGFCRQRASNRTRGFNEYATC